MPKLDQRFALIRDGRQWYAAAIADRNTGHESFRVSQRSKSRDAHGQAEQIADLEVAVRKVLREGKRIRCAPIGEKTSNSLDLESRGVTGYRLDPIIAARLGLPSEG